MYIRQVKPDEHRLMSSSTFTLRFILCPNISSLYILLNLFVNTSGLKRCLFKGMRTFQDLCIETPSQAYQVSKHRLKCDVFGDFVLQQTNMITLKNVEKWSTYLNRKYLHSINLISGMFTLHSNYSDINLLY